MREIKFRVWDREYNYMDYEPGKANLIGFDGTVYEEVEKSGFGQRWDEYEKAEKYILMQYTGIKDRNAKEIYEGDIIRWHDVVTSDYYVTFTDGVFCLENSPSENFYHHREEIGSKWEIIGNIYENGKI